MRILYSFVIFTLLISLPTQANHKKEIFEGIVMLDKTHIHHGVHCSHSTLPIGTIVEIKKKSDDQKMVKPLPGGRVTSGFGSRRCIGCSKNHEGADLGKAGNPIGAKIVAALPGTVSFAGREKGYGNVTILDHFNENGKVVKTTKYAHLNRCTAKKGKKVKKGQKIGEMGRSGGRYKPHLHFEMAKTTIGGLKGHKQGKKENPLPYLRGKLVIFDEKETIGDKKVICKVTSRSPFGFEVIRVSKGVAKKVGLDDPGVVDVVVSIKSMSLAGNTDVSQPPNLVRSQAPSARALFHLR